MKAVLAEQNHKSLVGMLRSHSIHLRLRTFGQSRSRRVFLSGLCALGRIQAYAEVLAERRAPLVVSLPPSLVLAVSVSPSVP